MSGDNLAMKRRDFFKTAAICGVASTLPSAFSQDKTTAPQEDDSMHPDMQKLAPPAA
jgi:hypothetical protein